MTVEMERWSAPLWASELKPQSLGPVWRHDLTRARALVEAHDAH